MGYRLDMSTGDMRQVIRLLTSLERTAEQEERLGRVREECARRDAELRARGINPQVSVAQALEELVEGEAGAVGCPSYLHAFQLTVAAHFSGAIDLGVWRRPDWFHTIGHELALHGVPSDLLPAAVLFSGPPLRLPHPGAAFPQIGVFPAQRAAELADAYERALPMLGPGHHETAAQFAGLMRHEADEWQNAQKLGRTDDTLFFWFR